MNPIKKKAVWKKCHDKEKLILKATKNNNETDEDYSISPKWKYTKMKKEYI